MFLQSLHSQSTHPTFAVPLLIYLSLNTPHYDILQRSESLGNITYTDLFRGIEIILW